MDYLNFELEVGAGSGREYEVHVRSPAGEAREPMRFPYDKLALENRLKDLQIALLRSGGKRRRVASPQEQAVQSFGLDLFNALIANEVRVRYDVSQGLAEREDKGLRLILRIQEPELAALPWEFLYDPRKGEYVSLSRSTPIVRYPESPQPVQPLWVIPPLHILGMAVSPLDLNPLDIEREKQRVEEAVERLSGLVTLTWLEGQTWQDLQEAMQRGPWHIFHFIGHGGFNQRSDEGLIALADEHGGTFELSATNLARLLDHRQLKLVLLNACEGARGGNIDVFSSTASILIRSGIPAVLAMQYEITDGAAIELSRSFYKAVAQGMPLEAAVVEARKAISIAVSNTVEWGTPVLYLRSTDGRLFNVNLRRDQINTLYNEAMAAMAGENWSSAIEKLRTVLEQDSDHKEAHNALRLAEERRKLLQLYTEGHEHYDAGRWYEARASFESAQAIESNFRDTFKLLGIIEGKINEERVAALLLQAETAVEEEEWDEAIGLLETASTISPGDKEILDRLNLARERKELAEIYAKGKGLYEAGKWVDALSYLKQVKAKAGDYKDVKAFADDAAEKAARESQEQNRRSKLAELRDSAGRAISEEDWPGAILFLKEILNSDQSDAEAQAKLIYVQRQKQLQEWYVEARENASAGRWEGALTVLRRISQIDPAYKDVAAQLRQAEHVHRVDMLYRGVLTDMEIERWKDAERKLQELLTLEPARRTEYLELQNAIGRHSTLQQLYAKGLEHYRKKRWRAAYESFRRVDGMESHYKDVGKLIERTQQELNRGSESSKKTIFSGKFLGATLIMIALIVSVLFGPILMKRDRPAADPVTPGNENRLDNKKENGVATPVSPPGMVYVPGGEFRMGRNNGDEYERPEHLVSIKPFFIDVYEVTCEEYQKFINDTGRHAPPNWIKGNYTPGAARKPVTGVTWNDADSYAKWAGKRLPTEEEWEFAARGTDGRLYPWGKEWKSGMANANSVSGGPVEVGRYKGASPFGAYDMVGNAWEWTASALKKYPGGKLPYEPQPDEKVIRGGTHASNRKEATATYRRGWRATGEEDYGNTGFRLVKDIE